MLKTFNSISGGKTSAYLEAKYPSDYRAFALVRTNDKNCIYKDKKVRQLVSDKIQTDFIGTLEDDIIINTILDLEQFTGREIKWVTGEAFEDLIMMGSGIPNIPNVMKRYCTSELKAKPMFDYWRSLNIEPWELRLGFRANEKRRALSTDNRVNENGYLTMKAIVGKSKNGNRNRWKEIQYQKPAYPLIEDNIYKDNVDEFWKDKPVRFAWMNNCVGCFHNNPLLLRKKFDLYPNKMQWFINQEEKGSVMKSNLWRAGKEKGLMYKDIKKWNPQQELFDEDFGDCDSGYCGI
tara:strand:+ start:36 stop:911 length:876 start_codon:yes stop_codon:yes gene_type:complete